MINYIYFVRTAQILIRSSIVRHSFDEIVRTGYDEHKLRIWTDQMARRVRDESGVSSGNRNRNGVRYLDVFQ